MAGSEGERGSKENSGGGYFSAQPWWACQRLTGRETRSENAQPLETWRFTPLTYLAWIGLLSHCSISKNTLITRNWRWPRCCRSRRRLRWRWWRLEFRSQGCVDWPRAKIAVTRKTKGRVPWISVIFWSNIYQWIGKNKSRDYKL